MTQTIEERKYTFAVVCEECGEPLKLLRLLADNEGWLAVCPDPECVTLHQGTF